MENNLDNIVLPKDFYIGRGKKRFVNEKYFVYDLKLNFIQEFDTFIELSNFTKTSIDKLRVSLDKKKRVGSVSEYYVKTQKINLIKKYADY